MRPPKGASGGVTTEAPPFCFCFVFFPSCASGGQEHPGAKDIPYLVSGPLLIQDIASWRRSGVQGLQSVVLYALPELDGAIDTVPWGAGGGRHTPGIPLFHLCVEPHVEAMVLRLVHPQAPLPSVLVLPLCWCYLSCWCHLSAGAVVLRGVGSRCQRGCGA